MWYMVQSIIVIPYQEGTHICMSIGVVWYVGAGMVGGGGGWCIDAYGGLWGVVYLLLWSDDWIG